MNGGNGDQVLDSDEIDYQKSPDSNSGGQFKEYRTENVYFNDGIINQKDSLKITAKCMMYRASYYSVHVILDKTETIEGDLPENNEARSQVIDKLYSWVETRLETYYDRMDLLFLIVLYDGQQIVFRHKGWQWGTVYLRDEDVNAFRDCLVSRGLPRDLYYAVDDLRSEVIPVDMFGRAVLKKVSFSPLRWARYLSRPQTLSIPSEDERQELFREACERFYQAVMLREAELAEPGKIQEPTSDREWAVLKLMIRLAEGKSSQRDTEGIWFSLGRLGVKRSPPWT